MNPLRIVLFSLVMLLYLYYPISMIRNYQQVLRKGELYRFRPQPVDPYDAFRGRYINLNFGNLGFDFPGAAEQLSAGSEVYLSLGRDVSGFAYFDRVLLDKPEHTAYVTSLVQSVLQDKVYVNLPENMSLYYINEKLAKLAEEAYRELTLNDAQQSDSVSVYLDVKVFEGIPVIDELYMKDLPITDYLRGLDR